MMRCCCSQVPSDAIAPIGFAVSDPGFQIGIVKLELIAGWIQKIKRFAFCFVFLPLSDPRIDEL
jgi:hypothetical protein